MLDRELNSKREIRLVKGFFRSDSAKVCHRVLENRGWIYQLSSSELLVRRWGKVWTGGKDHLFQHVWSPVSSTMISCIYYARRSSKSLAKRGQATHLTHSALTFNGSLFHFNTVRIFYDIYKAFMPLSHLLSNVTWFLGQACERVINVSREQTGQPILQWLQLVYCFSQFFANNTKNVYKKAL